MFRTRRPIATVVAAISTLGLTAGCGALQQAEDSNDDGPITIGHLTPKSGFLGQIGAQDVAGAKFAVKEINGDGGLLGRDLKLVSEDSIDPGTAVQKATGLVENEQVDALFGEISSASGLAIANIADRNKTVYFNTGWNSNQGRSGGCSRYVFHTDANNTMYVSAAGLWLTQQDKNATYYMLTADYAFGHDLRDETMRLFEKSGSTDSVVKDVLVPTGTRDYTTYIRKIIAAKPDFVFLNLAGEDQTTFLKQYTQEYGAPFPVTGGVMDTVQFWAAGPDNVTGVWPSTYDHTLETQENRDFVKRWRATHDGVPPDNQAWQSYTAVKVWAAAVEKAGSLDSEKVADTLRSGMKFDVLKERPAHINPQDNQLVYDMAAVEVDTEEMKDKYDLFNIIQPVPGKGDPAAIDIPAERSKCNL